ncbi:MAG TPA: S8 family serine peptidase [Candidatus Limnocylindria bacterium]
MTAVLATAVFVVAMLASSLDNAWTAASAFSVNVDPSLRAGDLALVHTTSGAAGALSVKLSGLGATGVETEAAADTVIARLSGAALAAIRTDATVTVAAADARVVATDWRPRGYESGAGSSTSSTSAALVSINAPRAWDTTTGAGVTVALMDTGVGTHPDLAGKVLARMDFVHDGSTSFDPAGHGTHIAGIIAANGGMKGVAPDANLVSLRVLDATGAGSLSDIVRAFDWLLQHHRQYAIKVVNLSWGMPQATSYNRDLLSGLVESAWFAGVTVVAATGNAGAGTMSSPASDPFVVAAGSFADQGTTKLNDDRESAFSSRATTLDGFARPDLLAPGEHVSSLRVAGDTYLDANGNPVGSPTDLYIKMTGTSAAAGFASGAAALVASSHPDWSPNKVKGALVASGRQIPQASAKGLDVARALTTNATANQGVAPSLLLIVMLTKSGLIKAGVTWESISWESISWESVTWDDITWEGVTWDTTGVTWEMAGLQ